jgi:hypothetical protein
LWTFEQNTGVLRCAQDDDLFFLTVPKSGDVGEAFGGDPAWGAVEVEGLGAVFLDEALVEEGPMAGFFSVEEVKWKGDE